MPYNTKPLKYDLATKPIPQHFNERIDDYEPLLGDHGASRVLLYDANGQPINPSNRLPADVTGSVGITGAVASNIQLIKDGQGRLYGYDGTTWRAVKVTTSGQLELAQNVVIDNVTVNVGAGVKVNNLETEPVPVTLSGKKVQLRHVNASSSAVVEAGKTENIDITPTAGHIGRLRGLTISQGAPTGATKNTHYCNILVGSVSLGQLSAGFDKKLGLEYSAPGAGTTIKPTDPLAFTTMLYNIMFSAAYPLRLRYTNGTDADQTTTRYIYALIEEEAIV